MRTMEKTNNQVQVIGRLDGDFQYSHMMYEEVFYRNTIKTTRISGKKDIVPILVSEKILKTIQPNKGDIVEVKGHFRSYNQKDLNGRSHLILNVFVREMNILDEYNSEDENIIKITHGFICKPPIFRKTPLGRDITDLMVAVNRQYIKSDYIPCIVWNEDAVLAASLQVGDEIQFKGRIQSREYMKKFPDSGKEEERIAYEVSINKLCKIG